MNLQNIILTSFFLGAVVHIFFAPLLANRLEGHRHAKWLHVFVEIEYIFALWAIPLLVVLALQTGPRHVLDYLTSVDYTEAFFVVTIMTIAGSKPVLDTCEHLMSFVARSFGNTTQAWWATILILAPLLGSLITEPAAMTIAALLLRRKFFEHQPHPTLAYATLGLLFVNVSVGGALTTFAAPPILMVAGTWHWTPSFMLQHFAPMCVGTVLISTFLYLIVFYKKFPKHKNIYTVPHYVKWQSAVYIAIMVFVVSHWHHWQWCAAGLILALMLGQFTNQKLPLKSALAVGIFLAGLVTHGAFQRWWLVAALGEVNSLALFSLGVFLTSFNDNAAVTYMSSLIPSFATNVAKQQAIVSGAIIGGGLTVIANAPNPAGQSILKAYFIGGVRAWPLFLGAAAPTTIAICLELAIR